MSYNDKYCNATLAAKWQRKGPHLLARVAAEISLRPPCGMPTRGSAMTNTRRGFLQLMGAGGAVAALFAVRRRRSIGKRPPLLVRADRRLYLPSSAR
ncbi:MAG: twin-arginine translocation signal domain-containing protein [Deltaproteobacteria bacterium]|nr:MAG: twin-arginine translocation signal domain-containing protein [Deltaproteobacteria bacterium]